jgi:hypothetical protein
MSYVALQASLHSTADAAQKFFRSSYGAKNIVIEKAIDSHSPYVTTLTGALQDYHTLCVEVREVVYSSALDPFVLDCRDRSIPIILFVAIPNGTRDPQFQANQKRAKQSGVGIVEVDDTGNGMVIQPAVSLSLGGVRRIRLADYPQKHRQALASAESTFINGNPAKGCSEVYDIIEDITRHLATKTAANKMWPNPLKVNLQTHSWALVLEALMEGLNYSSVKSVCPELKKVFVAELVGLTTYRNETGHKPKNRNQLITRDRQLRTRFEDACDKLLKLIQVTRPLHL